MFLQLQANLTSFLLNTVEFLSEQLIYRPEKERKSNCAASLFQLIAEANCTMRKKTIARGWLQGYNIVYCVTKSQDMYMTSLPHTFLYIKSKRHPNSLSLSKLIQKESPFVSFWRIPMFPDISNPPFLHGSQKNLKHMVSWVCFKYIFVWEVN